MKKKTAIVGLAFSAMLIFLVFFVLSIGDYSENDTLQFVEGGAVVISFDDNSISDWYQVDHVLEKYNWKATFFVSSFHSLHEPDIQRLEILQSKGHEIASHGSNHINATEFITTRSINEYIETEVLPSINDMADKGFVVSSFAYPFGAREVPEKNLLSKILKRIRFAIVENTITVLDEEILNHVSILRGITNGKRNPSKNVNFANDSRVNFGLSIDDSNGNNIEYLHKVLEYAKLNDKIAIFYGHQVSDDAILPKYTTSYHTLEEISKYVSENNMHFLTMTELVY